MARRMSSRSRRPSFSRDLFTHERARKSPREESAPVRRRDIQLAIRAARCVFIHNVGRRAEMGRGRDEETLKSHFNEKGKSRITALPLPDDGAVPAGTADR